MHLREVLLSLNASEKTKWGAAAPRGYAAPPALLLYVSGAKKKKLSHNALQPSATPKKVKAKPLRGGLRPALTFFRLSGPVSHWFFFLFFFFFFVFSGKGFKDMEELVVVCFRESWYKKHYRSGYVYQSYNRVNVWKEMREKDFERFKKCLLMKCNWSYRVDFVMIKNETVYVYEWDDGELIEYVTDEIPSWCKPLSF